MNTQTEARDIKDYFAIKNRSFIDSSMTMLVMHYTVSVLLLLLVCCFTVSDAVVDSSVINELTATFPHKNHHRIKKREETSYESHEEFTHEFDGDHDKDHHHHHPVHHHDHHHDDSSSKPHKRRRKKLHKLIDDEDKRKVMKESKFKNNHAKSSKNDKKMKSKHKIDKDLYSSINYYCALFIY